MPRPTLTSVPITKEIESDHFLSHQSISGSIDADSPTPLDMGAPAGAGAGSFSEPEEYEKCAIEPDEIGIGQATEMIAYICPRHRDDLVDHDLAWLLDPGYRRRLDSDPGQRRLDRTGRQRTDRNRSRRIKPIVLNNDDRSWLTGIGTPRSSDVNIAAPHSADSPSAVSQSTEIASTNAWSSASCSLAAMAADWR